MPVEGKSLTAQPTGDKVRSLLIVARDRLDLWDFWEQWFSATPEVQLILDRRHGERRQRVQSHEPERRDAERRCQPSIDEEIRATGFAIIRVSSE